jgi:hypothetical protein
MAQQVPTNVATKVARLGCYLHHSAKTSPEGLWANLARHNNLPSTSRVVGVLGNLLDAIILDGEKPGDFPSEHVT